jgi:hypothetical protein
MKNLFGEEIIVHETFPFNSDSKTAPGTAMSWANQRTWNWQTRSYEDDGFVPTVVELNNDPFDVTIIDLQVRSQGGRAYKVIDGESRVFDLREDQLLEALRLGGVQPGGKINGKFVWGVLSSQVRMVYVGGEMHGKMAAQLETNKELEVARANNLTPKASTFVVGRIYKKRDGSQHVFVGRVRTSDSKKKLFAFAQLPTSPYRHADETFNDLVAKYDRHGQWDKEYIDRLHRDQKAAVNWETMTWLERYQWAYEDYRVTEITLMSTPKFDSEESDDAQGVAERLRANVDNKHRYVDGFGTDLSHVRWKRKNNVDLDRWYGYRYTDSEREELVRNAISEFKLELDWD